MKLKTKRSKNITQQPIVAFGNLCFLLSLLSPFKDGRNGVIKFVSGLWKDWFDMLSQAYVSQA